MKSVFLGNLENVHIPKLIPDRKSWMFVCKAYQIIDELYKRTIKCIGT